MDRLIIPPVTDKKQFAYSIGTHCYTLLQFVTDMVHIVTDCCSLLQIGTHCYRLLQFVTDWYTLLQIVAVCYRLVHIVTDCCSLLQIGTDCYRLLQFDTGWYRLLQIVAV